MIKTKLSEMEILIKKGGIFKLICGAGNESIDEVYRLSFIYTVAGAKIIDVSAIPHIVTAANRGICDAHQFMKNNYKITKMKPSIMISVGVKEDPHTRKAQIRDYCRMDKCNRCVSVCPQNAINLPYIDQSLCIGCGKCQPLCEYNAITFSFISKTNTNNLIDCKQCGADMIELHASTSEIEYVISELESIKKIFNNNCISLCVNRKHLNDSELITMIKTAHNIIGDKLIVQADGIPMSGGEDTYNSTLQAIATADIIIKQLGFEIPIFISGGTNAKSAELAMVCDVNINGVAVGSYARQIIKNAPDNECAITIARNLVYNVYMGLK